METNIGNLSSTNMRSTVQEVRLQPKTTDGPVAGQDTVIDYPKFTKYLGLYKDYSQYKKAIDAIANYTVGKGYKADPATTVTLEHIKGCGEDTFNSIMWNMVTMKKATGDSFAEQIREARGKPLLNLKPLSPEKMRTVYGPDGRVKYFVQFDKGGDRIMEPWRILHLMNDRVADDLRGTAIGESCEWALIARQEAMQDWRRISHRATIRVMYVDADNISKIQQIKTEYATAIKHGELMIIPAKPGEAQFEDLTLPPIDAFLAWIKYLEDFLYTAIGVPRVVLGGSAEFTEASSKSALVTWDAVWKREQIELEADIWNQMGIKVSFIEPASLMNEMISAEGKNTGQTGFQANDVTAGSGQ